MKTDIHKMKKIILMLFLFIILLSVNYSIYNKEKILMNGRTVFLELAPVDPRSLMQGDYMRLRYKIADNDKLKNTAETDGKIILKLDEHNVAEFVDIYDENFKLEDNKILLRFRKRKYFVRLGAESFFFQEGHSKYYENAKYGELKIAEDGESILTGLRDDKLNALKPLKEDNK